jgi:ATP-binding cassette, subfamily C, bacterial
LSIRRGDAGRPEARVHRTIAALFRGHPFEGASVIALLFLAGMAEAVGVIALLPLLGLTTGGEVDIPIAGDLLTDLLEDLGLAGSIGALLVIIVAGIAAKAGLRILAMRQAGYAAARVGRDLRLELIRSLMSARWGYFTGQPVGSLANAVSAEAERASNVFIRSADFLARVIQVTVYVVLALVVSWQIALVTLLLGAIMVSSLAFLVRITRQAGRHQTEVMKSLTTRLSDGLYAIKPLKAMGREENLQTLLEAEAEDLNQAQRRQVLSQAVLDAAHEPIITLFVAIIIYVQLVVLGFPFSGVLFITFLFYRTATYVGTLQRQLQALVQHESAFWSLRNAIEEARSEAEILGSGTTPTLRAALEFQHVSFRYADRPVLRDVDLVIPAHALTAIIGPSGVGKTTIADLVAGLYVPDRGAVLIDGTDLRDLDVRAWRQRIGYVPQELILFHDSVYLNVGMGGGDVTRADVEAALRAAGAWDFVADLPDGIDTPVGEHGMRLSGGQRQRLAIARALVHKPDLLILDEATTALDPATERSILTTLSGLKSEVTMIAISHQTGLVEAADHVVRLLPGPSGARLEAEAPRARRSTVDGRAGHA